MKNAKKKRQKKPTTLAERHRRLVRPNQNVSDIDWLEQPMPASDSTEDVRFVTTYGVHDDPL